MHRINVSSSFSYARKQWTKFVSASNQRYMSDELFSLLDNLLRYDHQERLTAQEAMDHVFFAPVREFHAQQEAS